MRVALLGSMVLMYASLDRWIRPFPWQSLLESWGVPIHALLATILGIIGILGTIMVVSGSLGRLISIAVVFPIGFDIASRGMNWVNGIALGCTICLMLLGTGPGSLWPVEERFFMKKQGGGEKETVAIN
jgi:uncharacterized membrane protein YphA (DoxX/SURF4 family)